MLFEEHPLQRLGAFDPGVRRQRGATGDIPENGIGLREEASFGDLQQRHLAARILGEEVRRAALAAQDVDLDGMVGCVEQRQRKADLVAVAGALHGIELYIALLGLFDRRSRLNKAPRTQGNGET